MKTTNQLLLSLSLLTTTGCGDVIDPGPVSGDDSVLDIGIDGFDLLEPATPQPPALPFLVEMPQAATTEASLFPLTFARGSEIHDAVLSTSAEARFDVLEQRFVTTTDEAVQVSLSFAPPTGTFSRSIATDAPLNQPNPVGQQTLCSSNGIDYMQPECNLAAPAKGTTPATGPITSGRWAIRLINETTHARVEGCVPSGGYAIDCVLPASSAGTAYTVMVSADGFSDLWNGYPVLDELVLDGKRFTGVVQALEFQCSSFDIDPGKEWCYAHWVFNRYTAIDTASLAFDPMSVTISASGATKTFTSPAMTWDAGNDDLPGSTY